MAVVTTVYGPPLAATQDVYYYHQVGTSPFESWYIPGASGSSTTSTLAIASANLIYATPFLSTRAGAVIDRLAINVTTPSGTSSQNCRLGIYSATSATNIYPNTLVVDGGTLNLATSGANTLTISQTLTANTVYWVALIASVADAVISSVAGGIPLLGYPSTLSGGARTGMSVAQAFGAFPATFPAAASFLLSSAFSPGIYVRYSA